MHEAMEFLEHTDDVDLDKVRDWLPKLSGSGPTPQTRRTA